MEAIINIEVAINKVGIITIPNGLKKSLVIQSYGSSLSLQPER